MKTLPSLKLLRSVCVSLLAALFAVGCSATGGGERVYERLKYLAISELGNSQLVYTRDTSGDVYTIAMNDDGTYDSHTLRNADSTEGTWSTTATTVSFSEDGGGTYSITTTDGILREYTDHTINGYASSLGGVFQEMVGTGSGMVDFGSLFDKEYKVELRNADFNEHVTLEFDGFTASYESSEIGTGSVNHSGTYSTSYGGYDLELTLTETTMGDPTNQMVIEEASDWFIEGQNVTIGVLPYTVYNVEYTGG